MIYGSELRFPDQLQSYSSLTDIEFTHEYVARNQERLEHAYEEVRQLQLKPRQEDMDEHLLLAPGEMAWLESRGGEKGTNPKLQSKFVSPYHIIQAFFNHTYLIEWFIQLSV